MSFKKFKPNDVFYNVIKTHPYIDLAIYDSKIYRQSIPEIAGEFVTSVPNAPPGFISLYELNVDRTAAGTGLIYPFITKDGTLSNFRTVSTSQFNNAFAYGATITGSYPLTASISREFFTTTTRPHVDALQNTLNYNKYLSRHYAYSSSLGDKATQDLNLVSIPSIFFGSSIKKGTVDLNFYISGSSIGQLKDENQNGELIQVGPSGSVGSGSVAGVILYNEGFLVLTGSWSLEGATTRDYLGTGSPVESSWLYYAVGAQDGVAAGSIPSASYTMNFQGTNPVPTVTMLAHADRGDMNFTPNPTFVEHGQNQTINSSSYWVLEPDLTIKNTTESPYISGSAAFEKTTYITKVGIYDEDQNLIGIATVSKPVKKTEERNLTFKLKMDF
mgnify:CR=1 FL=1